MVAPPVVSIGMPVFNSGRFLRGAISDLLTQTFDDFELLISDNHSTDDTWELCQEIAAADLRVKLFRQDQNIGGLANFASVLKCATGKYFCWAADDDWHHSQFLQSTLAALLSNRNAGLAFSAFSIFNHETGSKSEVMNPVATSTSLLFEGLKSRFLNPVSNMFYGLMPTEFARRYFPHPYFDWGDAFMVAEISAYHDVEVVPLHLFRAGVKSTIRKPVAANGIEISARTYRHKCIKLAFKVLPPHKALQLSRIVWRKCAEMDDETRRAEAQYRAYARLKS
jgi:glycosyltransferase involved in cell wall biosynthesis